jgi:hypothetical protein
MSPAADRDARLLREFDALFELPAAEQARRLSDMALDDPLLATALRAMLGADTDADGPLEAGADYLNEALLASARRMPLAP